MISAAALVVPLSVFAASGTAHAGAPKVDVSQSTIICNTVNASTGIKPALSNTGASPALITVKGIVGGCTVTSGNQATNVTGSFTGKFTTPTNNCGALVSSQPVTGSITIKWKSDPSTPLLQTSTVVTPGTLAGNVFASAPWAGSGGVYGQFNLSGGGATGAFTGSDAGASSMTQAVTSEDVGSILGGCGTATGVKLLHLGIGQISLG